MKFATIVILFLASAVNAHKLSYATKALLIQYIDHARSKNEIAVTGPAANITAMATLGFKVTDMSFEKDENFCYFNVFMSNGDQREDYSHMMYTEKYLGPQRFSERSDEYKLVLNYCLDMAK